MSITLESRMAASADTRIRTLALVEVTSRRPGQDAYHAYVQLLNGRAQAAAEARGWSVVRVAASDVGTDALLALTDDADAVVVLGGEDVSPELYGATGGYPAEGLHAPVADEAQIALIRRTVSRGLPYLGICRGLQILNVALGGTLVQDLGTDTIHKNVGAPVERLMHTHGVTVAAGTALADALGTDVVTAQSAHHQAVGRLGEGLVAVAWAEDGVVEAVEHTSLPVLAVQWHPEDPGAPVGQLDSLFDRLAAAAHVTRSALAA